MLSSHALTELELRTDRIAILSKGQLVANDSLQKLRDIASLPIKFKVTASNDTIEGINQQLGGKRSIANHLNWYAHQMKKNRRSLRNYRAGPDC